MLKKTLISLALGAAIAAQAQSPAAPASAAAAAAPSSPAKKELVTRLLKDQQPGIEAVARSLVEQPAMELLQDVQRALPARIPKENQDSVARDIQADVKKYLDDAVPYVQQRAVRLAPGTVGTMLEEKFSEDELKQLAGILESPVYAKFQRVGDEMRKALADKLVADTRTSIEPKVRAMEEAVAKRLGMTQPQAGGAPAPKAATRPSKPASK